MVVQGVGSISSPIVISDDEDEAMIDLQLRVDSDSVNSDQNNQPHTPPDGNSEELSTASKGYAMALNMGYCPGRGLGRGLDGECRGSARPSLIHMVSRSSGARVS
jgi:hypothetical protein